MDQNDVDVWEDYWRSNPYSFRNGWDGTM